MKVQANQPGFFGSYREEGDVFEVPDGTKATWFSPVEPEKEPRKAGKGQA